MTYGRFEIKTEIWSLRDLLKSFEFLELLYLVKVTKTHTQSGLQSSFLSNGLHFPSPARMFCLQHFCLYLYFFTPFLLPLILFQHHLILIQTWPTFFQSCLAPSPLLTLLPKFFHSPSPQLPLLSHSSTLGLLSPTGMFALILESV